MNRYRRLAGLLTLSLLAACTSGTATTAPVPSSSAAAGTASAPPSEAATPAAPVSLVLLMPDSSEATVLTPEVARYESLHPNVTITVKQVGQSEAFLPGLQTLLNSGQQIDVMYMGGDSFETAVTENLLLDVTDKITYYDRFNQDLVYKGFYEVDGRRYGVPTGIGYIAGWMYNQALLTSVGIPSFPQTYSDLVTDSAKLKAANVVPVAGYGTEWNFYAIMALHTVLDQMSGNNMIQTIRDTLTDKTKFTDPIYQNAWTCALQYFKDNLFQIQPGSSNALWLGANDTTAAALLPAGKVAMNWDGNWDFPTLKQAAASSGGKFDLALGAPPVCSNAPAGATQHLIAYPPNLWSISKTSTHVDESLALLDYLSSDQNASEWMTFFKTNLTSNVNATPPTSDALDATAKTLYATGVIDATWPMGIDLSQEYAAEFQKVVLGKQSIDQGLAALEAWKQANKAKLPH